MNEVIQNAKEILFLILKVSRTRTITGTVEGKHGGERSRAYAINRMVYVLRVTHCELKRKTGMKEKRRDAPNQSTGW